MKERGGGERKRREQRGIEERRSEEEERAREWEREGSNKGECGGMRIERKKARDEEGGWNRRGEDEE